MTTPAVRLLREKYPEAQIDYVIEPFFREGVSGLPEINETVSYDRARLRRFPRENLQFMLEMRRRRYDVVIDFHGGPRSGLITRMTNAPLRIGYTGPQAIFFYNCRIKRNLPGRRFHSVIQQIRLLEPLGILPGDAVPAVAMPVPDESSSRLAQRLLDDARSHGFSGIASVHVPSLNPFRNWGTDRIVMVSRGLADRGLRPVFLGSSDSVTVANAVQEKLASSPVSLLGQTGVSELRAVIAASRIFIGVDSGPMHVAATTGTPIVAIFGPNLPRISGPWSGRATIIEEDLSCRPCDQRQCVFGDFRCFGRIDPARIIEAIDRWLAEPPVERPVERLSARLYGDPARS